MVLAHMKVALLKEEIDNSPSPCVSKSCYYWSYGHQGSVSTIAAASSLASGQNKSNCNSSNCF